MRPLPRAWACLLLAATVCGGLGVAARASEPADPQAGYLADWADRSTWRRRDKATGKVEVGLGLVLNGSAGAMRLAFYVEDPTPIVPAGLRPVRFRVAAGPRLNPGILRTPTLTFTAVVSIDGAKPRPVTIDASSTMTVDNPAPGAPVTSATGTLPQGAIQALADASALSGSILGVPVSFRDDQRGAIRAFRDRVAPKGPRRPSE
jgi:hypothetical protein